MWFKILKRSKANFIRIRILQRKNKLNYNPYSNLIQAFNWNKLFILKKYVHRGKACYDSVLFDRLQLSIFFQKYLRHIKLDLQLNCVILLRNIDFLSFLFLATCWPNNSCLYSCLCMSRTWVYKRKYLKFFHFSLRV